jgi:hypothetical protein
LMNDPDIGDIVAGRTVKNSNARLPMLRDKLVAKILQVEAAHAHPGAEVLESVKIYEKLPEATREQWNANHPGKEPSGIVERDDGLYKQRGEIDMIVVQRQVLGKAKIIAREEIKTGVLDTNADARAQLGAGQSFARWRRWKDVDSTRSGCP